MSRKELDKKHQKAGATRKSLGKEIEVNTIDFIPAKPPATSTYKTHVRELGKRIAQTAATVPIYNNFDRLKICIDLRLYDKKIEFELKSLVNMNHPEKKESYLKKKIVTNRHIKVMFSDNPENAVDVDRDDYLEDYDLDEMDEPLPKRKGESIYPNCGIPQKALPTGLNAIYIKDDYLIIDITGKLMADKGYLGYINAHNIAQCLGKIRDMGYVYFNVAQAIPIATVRLCDVTLDLETFNQKKLVSGMSAMTPTIASNYRTYNYKNGGLIIRSIAKSVGMSFSMYDKGRELNDKRHNYYTYLKTIGDEGLEKAYRTLRLEVHLWRLRDIREILEFPNNEAYQVSLHDVIMSKTPAVLNVMKKYKFTEEILHDEIKGFTDEYLTPVQTDNEVIELLAGIGMMSVLSKQEGMYRQTRDLLGKFFRMEDDDNLMKILTKSMHRAFYNFILYFRATAIKDVLELLDLIHKGYGRNSTNSDNELKKAA